MLGQNGHIADLIQGWSVQIQSTVGKSQISVPDIWCVLAWMIEAQVSAIPFYRPKPTDYIVMGDWFCKNHVYVSL